MTASATIRNPQTFNRYSYVLNSPYKFTDPLGLIPVDESSQMAQLRGSHCNMGRCTNNAAPSATTLVPPPDPHSSNDAAGENSQPSTIGGSPAEGAPVASPPAPLPYYFDDALAKAYLSKSKLVLIIKMTNVKNSPLAQTRLKNLKNYMLFRDFKNFAVGVDLDKNATDVVDFYVKGELIYSLQIERNDKLDQFGHC